MIDFAPLQRCELAPGPASARRAGVEPLESLEREWRSLVPQTAHASTFLSYEWAWCWWRVFLDGDPSALRTLAVRAEGGEAIGIAPFYLRQRARGWGLPCQSREWRLLGNTGRDYEGLVEEPMVLARAGDEARVRDAVLSHLTTVARREWDYVKFSLTDIEGGLGLPEERGRGFRARRAPGSVTRTLPADWPTLRKTLTRSMRDNTSYYPRLLKRHGHATALRFHRTPDEVRGALPTLVRLHRHRARSERFQTEHASHIRDERQARFLEECLPRLAAWGGAFLIVLEAGGVPIGAQAFLETQGTLAFYYSGFDADWQSYSPLLLIAQAALEDAMARGVQTVNFLPGEALWKSRWGAEAKGAHQEIKLNRTSPDALLRSVLTLGIRQIAGLKKSR